MDNNLKFNKITKVETYLISCGKKNILQNNLKRIMHRKDNNKIQLILWREQKKNKVNTTHPLVSEKKKQNKNVCIFLEKVQHLFHFADGNVLKR